MAFNTCLKYFGLRGPSVRTTPLLLKKNSTLSNNCQRRFLLSATFQGFVQVDVNEYFRTSTHAGNDSFSSRESCCQVNMRPAHLLQPFFFNQRPALHVSAMDHNRKIFAGLDLLVINIQLLLISILRQEFCTFMECPWFALIYNLLFSSFNANLCLSLVATASLISWRV